LVDGELRVQDVREVEVEDLLGRDPVAPNQGLLASCITGKTVLVTGAGGSIGAELCRQILPLKPTRLILLEVSEYALYAIESELLGFMQQKKLETVIMPFLGSILDHDKNLRIMQTFKVDTIYHAAA